MLTEYSLEYLRKESTGLNLAQKEKRQEFATKLFEIEMGNCWIQTCRMWLYMCTSALRTVTLCTTRCGFIEVFCSKLSKSNAEQNMLQSARVDSQFEPSNFQMKNMSFNQSVLKSAVLVNTGLCKYLDSSLCVCFGTANYPALYLVS
jgi:hypothetical protein